MTLFADGGHFLSYGATDQETLRKLRGSYSGLLVPGTIAAFQQQGTGGFVLSLSGSLAAVPYAIDSRFPLFQQRLTTPKKSHLALATIFEDPGLVVPDREPVPSDFPPDRIERLVAAWLTFNSGYSTANSAKLSKYARRLGEDVQPSAARGPSDILAPYFMQTSAAWTELSLALATESRKQGGRGVVPTVAVLSAAELEDAVRSEPAERVAIWINDFGERGVGANDLAQVLSSVARLSSEGRELFALYGGFLSALALPLGLRGFSHGIGFGEHRAWLELPSSGPAPARYYAPMLHRFLRQDVAQSLFNISPGLVRCSCQICDERPPLLLEYHELMQHSVLSRNTEIQAYRDVSPREALASVEQELRRARELVEEGYNQLRIFVAEPRTLVQALAVGTDALRQVLDSS